LDEPDGYRNVAGTILSTPSSRRQGMTAGEKFSQGDNFRSRWVLGGDCQTRGRVNKRERHGEHSREEVTNGTKRAQRGGSAVTEGGKG